MGNWESNAANNDSFGTELITREIGAAVGDNYKDQADKLLADLWCQW